MSKWAMILAGRVIEVMEQNEMPIFPPDQYGNEVEAILCDDTIQKGMSYDPAKKLFLAQKFDKTERESCYKPTEQEITQAKLDYLLMMQE